MSWHPQYGSDAPGANGAHGSYGANGAYQGNGEPQGAPQVYHPYGDQTPTYDAYADPAAAHGWHEPMAPEPGVDDTVAFEAVHGVHDAGPAYAGQGAHGDAYGDGAYPDGAYDDDAYGKAYDDGDRSVFVDGSGRRGRLVRRVALAVGAVCVVFIGVVIAGFFGSGPAGGPLPWGRGDDDKPHPRAEHSSAPSQQPAWKDGATTPAAEPSAGASSTAEPSASPGASDTSEAETRQPTTQAPTTTASSTTTAPGRGNSGNNPGHGSGGPGTTKRPK